MIAPRPTTPGQSAVHRSPVTLQDLLDDLLWPHLLRSWKLALAPGRVALCFLLVMFMGGVIFTFQWATGTKAFRELADTVVRDFHSVLSVFKGPEAAALSAYDLFVRTPAQLVIDHPVVAFVYLPAMLLVWCAVGGAVCRSCACEVSLRAALPWRQAVGFGLKKSLALFAALAGPLVLVWVACLLLKLFGLALFTSNVMGVLGGVLFIVPLVLCLVMAAACTAYLLAHSLLIPAVSCEGTDSFDAVQRCYAYVLARPGRLVGYIAVSLFATVPAVVIVSMIGVFAIVMALLITRAPLPGIDVAWQAESAEGYPFTRWVVHIWIRLVLAVGASYFVSLYFCAATNLYLVMRRLVDGQDIAELWTPPTAVPAVASPLTPTPPAIPPIPEKADYT